MLKQKKLLLYGGSFDPIHKGHENLLKAAIKKVKPDLTILMPSKIPPLKANNCFANAQQRLEMVKLVFNHKPKILVSDFEINQEGNFPSFTYLTIKHLKQQYPNYKIYLLLGSDRLYDFKRWKNSDFILANVTIVAGSRYSNEKIKNFKGIKIHYQAIPISSEQLRRVPNKEFINSKVVKYIAAHGLYAINHVQSILSQKRFNHVLRVVDTALEIAKANKYKNLDEVFLSAIYHDVCKETSEQELLKLVGKYDHKHYPTIHTTHGLAGAIYAKKYFNITNRKVLQAITNHVVGSKNMSDLDKILYCADKLEPARTKQDVSDRVGILKLCQKNLNKGFNKLYREVTSKYA